MIYKNNSKIKDFIDEWQNIHPYPNYEDQLSFRTALFNHPIEVAPLSERYNVLTNTTISGPVKILHDDINDLNDVSQKKLDEILEQINHHKGIRIPNKSYSKRVPAAPAKLLPLQLTLEIYRHGILGIWPVIRRTLQL